MLAGLVMVGASLLNPPTPQDLAREQAFRIGSAVVTVQSEAVGRAAVSEVLWRIRSQAPRQQEESGHPRPEYPRALSELQELYKQSLRRSQMERLAIKAGFAVQSACERAQFGRDLGTTGSRMIQEALRRYNRQFLQEQFLELQRSDR
jgi:hypothetical protein